MDNLLTVRRTGKVIEPWLCEIRSKSRGFRMKADLFQVFVRVKTDDPIFLCRHRHLTSDIPIGLLMRALGITDDVQIFQTICGISFLQS